MGEIRFKAAQTLELGGSLDETPLENCDEKDSK